MGLQAQCSLLQVLPVPSQVRALRTHPQGDPHWLPIHQPGQGQEEQAYGHGCLGTDSQPQQLLHQLRQFSGLLRGGTAQPKRPGKGGEPAGVHSSVVSLHCCDGGGDWMGGQPFPHSGRIQRAGQARHKGRRGHVDREETRGRKVTDQKVTQGQG